MGYRPFFYHAFRRKFFARLLSNFVVSILLVFALSTSAFAGAKVLILWGPGGHETAAKAIRANILKTDPHAEIIFKNITELLPPAKAVMYGDFYGWMNRNAPELFLTVGMEPGLVSARGNATIGARGAARLTSSPDRLLKYIHEVNPTSIVTTHFFIAETLAQLRERGELHEYPTAFLHTDIVSETFYAQLSATLDMTFLPIQDLTDNWQIRGIPADRVMTTGIPVNPIYDRRYSPSELSEIVTELKLEPERKKILLMGGTFGFLEYEELVNKISAQFSEPIEIIAVCGKNKAQRARLERMIRRQGRNVPGGGLPLNVKLRTAGLIPQEELIKYLAVTDQIVTKPGGLTTFELMYREKPVVFITPGGGVEGFNASYIDQAGAGRVVRTSEEAATALREIASSPEIAKNMIESQRKVRKNFHPEGITEWALHPPAVHHPMILPTPVLTIGDTVQTHYRRICSDLFKAVRRFIKL